MVPTKPPNKGDDREHRSDGRPQTGTKVETLDTAKGTPEAGSGNGRSTAEGVEGKGLAKGNSRRQNTVRTQDRETVSSALERIGLAARRDKRMKFTTLMHHIYSLATLREAYFGLKRNAAPGIDETTWQEYGVNLEGNISDISERLKRGAYRAKPARRVLIPKADGGQRPLAVTALEDKLVQRATSSVLQSIYEEDFLGFSYGFRPGRGPHDALDALVVGIKRKRVDYVLDADIRGFFDSTSHEWLVKFVEHRVSDRRIIRLIQKWLTAGVLEDGAWRPSEMGTPQGSGISPILANVYLHYAFDLWAHDWRKRAQGDVIIVRFVDDFIVGFETETDARQFWADLAERLAKFGLALHPEKSRLLEFGRFAAKSRRRNGRGKPETFDFLGFTHVCGTTRGGKLQVLRQTARKRLRRKLHEISTELRRRMHDPVPEVGKYLRSVVQGHLNYYGVPMNHRAPRRFRDQVAWLWRRVLSRRSQKASVSWARMSRLVARWLPPVRVTHPYPEERLCLTT